MFIYPTRNYARFETPHHIKSTPPQRSVFLPQTQQQHIPPQGHKPPKIHLPENFLAVAVQIVYTGDTANIPMVARVSLADYRGNVVLDTLVRPTHEVTDYRTAETGLVADHLTNAPLFREVRDHVLALIRDKIIVGHCLWQFLSVLCISHPTVDTRDVAAFVPFRRGLGCGSATPPLQVLVHRLMGRSMGLGYEHPLENARAALDLYRSAQHPWESAIDSGSWPCTLPPVGYAEYFL
ncbi:hypothetical protein BJV78DRAFT_1200112 [Lactifluus subvellereus]|nr:hypothetical protein BJV78DRAFT_1200112 [Lactifluus subvellereus]